jgi:hypothetical protein
VERAIEVTTAAEAPYARCRDVLLADPRRTIVAAAYPGMVMEVGDAIDGATLRWPLSWRATSFERLIPVFEGEFELMSDDDTRSVLALRGLYAVPLGAMGRFGDGLVGRRVARRTAVGVVEAIAASVEHGLTRLNGAAETAAPQARKQTTVVRDRESG